VKSEAGGAVQIPVVAVRGARKVYRERFRRAGIVALDGASLAVAPGEILGFVGPNGAGKSTLLLAMAGMLSLDEGEILVNGEPMQRPGNRITGYAPERSAFEPVATVNETLRLLAALRGMSGAEAREAAADALELVALIEFGDRRVQSLSRGMTQRLALAQALMGMPPVVLLDETLSGVDPVVHRQICEVIGALPSRGTTVILSSHDLSAVEELATRVAVMDTGSVRGVLTAAEFARPGALRERFFELLGGGGVRPLHRHAAG
jgi:ABC-2 type transport system ATP-binding protein